MKIDVSIGEVVDKITILQIKQEKITDEVKAFHVTTELKLLQETLNESEITIPTEMIDELKQINQTLWDTEDIIREKERNHQFDDEFVKHARLDAKLNDKRFLVKNKINQHCNSLVKEQKSYEDLYTTD
jgi:hypothetical protein